MRRPCLSATAKYTISAIALIALSPLQALAADYGKEYNALNIFGDSLVDAGNIFNLTGLPPSPPYDQKLSNGVVWIEPLADELGLKPTLSTDALPALFSGDLPKEGVNFALAGSLSSDANVGGSLLPGLQQQIETFGAFSSIFPPDSNALFVLLAGGNDYNEALLAPDSLTTTLEDLPNQVTDNLAAATAALIGLGAENLLVADLPNLGLQPFAQQLNQFDPRSSALLTALSAEHNLLLDQKLSALSAASPAKITQLRLSELFDDIATDPGSFGFTNTADSCLTSFQPGFVFEGICDNPDEFVFWDNVHPTAAVHNEIAQFALMALHPEHSSEVPQWIPQNGAPQNGASQSVPEPTSIVGLLLLGSGTALTIGKRSKQRQTS